ncbi:MAG: TonB-dependent receptor [Glaciecola sp.]|nr:TonB-dependent receptor [Glaciecola sp.]MDG1816413.1 TonB-dependent receptor [Glaciecola sp.]MDG2098472.1 TonB-dependent receptor [Glaciecola sp.]
MKINKLHLSMLIALGGQLPAIAETNEDSKIERISVTQSVPENTNFVPGTVQVLTREDLDQQRVFSVKEALENIAGINVISEDVFSARLNIGIRGLNPRRSSRVLLMEDGMPLFLSPYGDPSASYSTPMDNVDRIEVTKGSGQIIHGPQTIAGIINFVTNPVPRDGVEGQVNVELGNNNFQSLYGRVGVGNQQGGVMISVMDKEGDGSRENHTLGIQDYSIKGLLQLNEQHSIIAKISQFEELSRQSETGLSAAEYAENPFQAPTGLIDRFQQQRDTFQLVHDFEISPTAQLSTQAYRVEQTRASFRQINGPGENIEFCPGENGATGDIAGEEEALAPTLENSLVCGGRWRPREFEYFGIEPRLSIVHDYFGDKSEAVIGFRYHEEDILRNQFRGFDSRFHNLGFAQQYAGVDENDGRAGWHNEQIETQVEAMSFYLQNSVFMGDWTLTPGFRLEDVTQTTDYVRTEGAAPTNPEKKYTHDFTVFLPGLGATYKVDENTTWFAGIHKGFAPARPSREVDSDEPDASFLATDPEESWNYEIGLRSSVIKGVQAEATLFFTNFNQIVIQTEAGRFINAGESRQSGIEIAGQFDSAERFGTKHNIYIQGNLSNLFLAEFTNSQTVWDEEGEEILETASFESGNRLPYAPKLSATVAVGYQSPDRKLDARLALNHTGEQFVDAANTSVESDDGMEGKIPAYTLINMSVNYEFNDNLTVFLSGHNLTDKEYLASRKDGMVVGRTRQLNAGFNYRF